MSSTRRFCLALGVAGALALTACSSLKSYKPVIPDAAAIPLCEPDRSDDPERAGSVDKACRETASERAAAYTLHFVEFDDQGWVFDDDQAQIDSAIDKIKRSLHERKRLRLFVYVHGWRHSARYDDSNVRDFRLFLNETRAATRCGGAEIAAVRTDSPSSIQSSLERCKNGASDEEIVGIYVGWRGLPIPDGSPLTYLTFWDRKRTADRIAQGSVRELFGRLNALAGRYPDATVTTAKTGSAASARQPSLLRTQVIGHSFGASIVFRALSQSIIDSFDHDLDGEVTSVTRFVDRVVLINPAIEASRFEPVRSAAMKRVEYCLRATPDNLIRCERPAYQGAVLAIFTSEGDLATKTFFPIGAILSNTFETTRSERQTTAMNTTVGWDDGFRTHQLRAVTAPCTGASSDSPHRPGADGVDRIDPPGWAWCLTDSALLQHLPTSAGQPTYNGPFWAVRVAPQIVRDHNDIWNPRFRSVLLRVFADEQRFPALR